jgi:hypothetical protein
LEIGGVAEEVGEDAYSNGKKMVRRKIRTWVDVLGPQSSKRRSDDLRLERKEKKT